MAANEPIVLRVRVANSQWPDDAPCGAVSTFCPDHAISRTSFHELRKRSWFDRPVSSRYIPPQPPPPARLPADTRVPKVSSVGAAHVDKVFHKIDVEHRFEQVLDITDRDKLTSPS